MADVTLQLQKQISLHRNGPNQATESELPDAHIPTGYTVLEHIVKGEKFFYWLRYDGTFSSDFCNKWDTYCHLQKNARDSMSPYVNHTRGNRGPY